MTDTAPPHPFAKISARESEIALLLARGDTCREIAEALKLSVKTVDTHRLNILRKLELRGTVDLARYAIRHGLVTP